MADKTTDTLIENSVLRRIFGPIKGISTMP
jgi:hypothetical protein